MKKHSFSPEYIASRLRYDPVSGVVFWRPIAVTQPMNNQWNVRFAGKPAGHKQSDGYIRIGFNVGGGRTRHVQAHNVAWCLTYGNWPEELIDHKNCDASDNRLCNLREATISENTHNQRLNRNNECGMKGVSFLSRKKRWRARIALDGERRHLGYFDTKEQAAVAYRVAAEELHGNFARVA